MKEKILIVDDNDNNRYMLEILLKSQEYDVISAENGEEALAKARLNPPDMIVTDILMPVMDGYTLCRQWKSDEAFKHIPLVFYTAEYTGLKNEEFASSLGADRFIVKPQEPNILLEMLKEVLAKKHTSMQTTTNPLGEEMEYFRQYNEILFRKLEKKMSDLELANKELRVSEENYRLSFENVTDIIYTTDANLNILTVSPSVKKILGYNPEDFVGRPLSALGSIHTRQSLAQTLSDIHMIERGETIPATVYDLIAKDGSIKYCEVIRSPVMREGKNVGMISVARDITERMHKEEELKAAFIKRQELEFIINHSPAAVWLWKAVEGWPVEYVSDNISLYGYAPDDFTSGRVQYTSIVYSDDLSRVSAEVEQYVKEGKTEFTQEYRIITKSGEIRWIDDRTWVRRKSDGSVSHYQGIAIDITKRKLAEKALEETLENLKKALNTTIQVMVSAVESRDPYTAGHQLRVADMARAIAVEMGLSPDRIEGIYMAASIHDIGKLAIPAEILVKPTKLTDIEFSLVKEHANKGYEILKGVESPWPLAEIVYQHHERIDGLGYPRNLKGDDILMEARIMAVADVVESMASHRPYRPALGIGTALQEIEKNKNILYDSAVADACLRLFREKGYQLKMANM